jgi:hypothetical protein
MILPLHRSTAVGTVRASTTHGRAANLVGWVAVVLASLASSFWAFWGVNEAFHEGLPSRLETVPSVSTRNQLAAASGLSGESGRRLTD